MGVTLNVGGNTMSHASALGGNMQRKRGQGMTEYIIVIAIIAIGAILIVGVFGKQIKNTFARISQSLSGQTKGADTPDVSSSEKRDTLGDFDQGASGSK